jgi:hypothetical protein
MKTIIQTTAALFAAAMILGTAKAQDNGGFPQPQMQSPAWTGNNDFTNKVVVPTPQYLTNSQASACAIQQSRVQQEGNITKPAATMAHGPRIEQRPPTTVMQSDPWIQQQHLWDISPDVEPSTSPGHKE